MRRDRPQKIMGYTLMILGLAVVLAPQLGVEAPEFLNYIGWTMAGVGFIVRTVRLTSLRP